MSSACVGVARAVEYDVFLCVPVGPVWVRGFKLGMVRVGAWAQGRVVRSLSEAVGVVSVKGMVCSPTKDGG